MIGHDLLVFAHVVGMLLIAAGLIGVFLADLRSRQLRNLAAFAETVRAIAVFYDGLVVPGALLLLASGTALIISAGYEVLATPWLAGMIALFLFEFIEGNTITRLYFRRLRRLTRQALAEGGPTPALATVRTTGLATFTHFLDLPIFFLIVSLGMLRPATWSHFTIGAVIAIGVGGALTLALPRLYPWPELEGAHPRMGEG